MCSIGSSKEDSEGKNVTLSRSEVIKRLRERGEPILMFGESEIDTFSRLRRCEMLEPEINKVQLISESHLNGLMLPKGLWILKNYVLKFNNY